MDYPPPFPPPSPPGGGGKGEGGMRRGRRLLGRARPRVDVLARGELGRPERHVLAVLDLGGEGIQRPLPGGVRVPVLALLVEAEPAADGLDVELFERGHELLPIQGSRLLQPGPERLEAEEVDRGPGVILDLDPGLLEQLLELGHVWAALY